MIEPRVALQHWLRVLKPGGHLVVTVPDEDLYEQGVWPSTFNGDHKHTFTMFKQRSWSPVSINVLDCCEGSSAKSASKRSSAWITASCRDIERYDQTRSAFAECGIEIIVKKL